MITRNKILVVLIFTNTMVAACGQVLLDERTHDVTVDDYFTLAVMGTCAVSPNGKDIAYTEIRWEPPEEKRNTDLWVVNTESREIKRLTFDKAADSSPTWSPDGAYLYFASNRTRAGEDAPPFDGSKQVWRVALDGGEPFAVTRVKDGIDLYHLSHDGRTLYYTVSDEVVDEAWKELRGNYKSLTYGHGVTNFSQLWKLDLTTWRATKLIDEKRVVREFALSPDERRIAMVTTPDETLLTNEGWSRVDVFDMATGKISSLTDEAWRKPHPSPYGWIDGLTWSADNTALGFTVSFDGYPTQVYVQEWKDETPLLRELQRPYNVTITGATTKWRGDTRDLCFIAETKAKARVWCLENVREGGQGASRPWGHEEAVAHAFDFARSGESLAVIAGTLWHTPDLYLADRHSTNTRITNSNPQVDNWKLPQILVVSWKGANDDDVEGILELPPDYKAGRPLPMVVELHGGPTAATMAELRYWIYGRTLLPAKGYALFSPNYRGSTGYGDRFMTDLVGGENDIEVEDILRGVDEMIARGFADPDRLGVMGWSNGGFLTNSLITKTDRFKAASSGAGVLDMVMQWGMEDTPGHVINFMRGLPWAKPDAYRLGSPLYQLDRVRTPTLIHVGENDERVPAAHSRTLYRALRHYVNVPTELIVYPGEGHGLSTYTHRKAKMEWDLAWFERYLLGKSQELPSKSTTN